MYQWEVPRTVSHLCYLSLERHWGLQVQRKCLLAVQGGPPRMRYRISSWLLCRTRIDFNCCIIDWILGLILTVASRPQKNVSIEWYLSCRYIGTELIFKNTLHRNILCPSIIFKWRSLTIAGCTAWGTLCMKNYTIMNVWISLYDWLIILKYFITQPFRKLGWCNVSLSTSNFLYVCLRCFLAAALSLLMKYGE